MCKYRLTDNGKKQLKDIALDITVIVCTAILFIAGILSILLAIIYPFTGTLNEPLWVNITAWSVYITLFITVMVYSWKWIKSSTEKCD